MNGLVLKLLMAVTGPLTSLVRGITTARAPNPKGSDAAGDYVVRCRTIEIMQLRLYERGNAAALRGFCTLRKYLYNMVVGFPAAAELRTRI